MAVDPIELRPKNAIALVDASIRLCSTSADVWVLTLPAGALLVAALFPLVDAISHGRPLLVPAALWTGAWLVRGLSQGAATHYLEQQILGTTAASLSASIGAALKRLPTLFIATALVTVLNLCLWFFTLGFGFLFVSAHAVAYPVVMRGQGHSLGLYGHCAKLLGAARQVVPWVRLCGLTQLLLGINLHFVVQLLLTGANSLLGFDLTFVGRLASLDNPAWVGTLAVITFALFEPLRAATATLLLIDGRVRQEGLDLIAQVGQFPRRKRSSPSEKSWSTTNV